MTIAIRRKQQGEIRMNLEDMDAALIQKGGHADAMYNTTISTIYNKIMPAPAIPANKRYAPNCNKPVSRRGTVTAPAALLLVEAPDDLLEDPPVAVGAEVTVPVPAVPAWLKRLEQVELVAPVWTLAFPEKLQAVDALP
jgi:hypothetical protein